MVDTWYVIEAPIEKAKELYTVLRDRLECNGLAGNNLYNLARGNPVFIGNVKTIYVQLSIDSTGCWHYIGTGCGIYCVTDQAIDLTLNEFYSRFLQHTVTL